MSGFGGKTHVNKGGSWQSQRTIVPKENRTSTDGIVHRTRAECKRWDQLRLLEQNGYIRGLRREVKYKLEINIGEDDHAYANWIRITSPKGNVRTYTADFVYEKIVNAQECERHEFGTAAIGEWREIIEDIKGFLEPAQELRLDVFQALYRVRVFINKV